MLLFILHGLIVFIVTAVKGFFYMSAVICVIQEMTDKFRSVWADLECSLGVIHFIT